MPAASKDANAEWVRWNGHLDTLVEVEVLDHTLKLEQAPASNDLGKTGREWRMAPLSTRRRVEQIMHQLTTAGRAFSVGREHRPGALPSSGKRQSPNACAACHGARMRLAGQKYIVKHADFKKGR